MGVRATGGWVFRPAPGWAPRPSQPDGSVYSARTRWIKEDGSGSATSKSVAQCVQRTVPPHTQSLAKSELGAAAWVDTAQSFPLGIQTLPISPLWHGSPLGNLIGSGQPGRFVQDLDPASEDRTQHPRIKGVVGSSNPAHANAPSAPGKAAS